MIARQDYELLEQLMNADLSFQHDKNENGEDLLMLVMPVMLNN